jgi:hypothetical protein
MGRVKLIIKVVRISPVFLGKNLLDMFPSVAIITKFISAVTELLSFYFYSVYFRNSKDSSILTVFKGSTTWQI